MLKNIKFGIKLSINDFSLISQIYESQDLIDFIEIILNPEFKNEDIRVIKGLKLPYIIHIPSSNYGIDFGEPNKSKNNECYIDKINTYRKDLEPLCYIVHPESGHFNYSINNLKKLKVFPLAIENMPYKSIFGGKLLGYNSESLKKFFEEIPNLEFCLDINHAIKASISLKANPFSLLRELIEFKEPIVFHISDGNLNEEKDEHLPLKEGKYDLKNIKQLLFEYGKMINLTFETPRNDSKTIVDDIRNMLLFKKS